MARRKALSAELDPRVRQLVTELRGLTDHGELSMRQLAAKTGYSQKSWERYLGGRSLPPRDAVEKLARIGGVDPVRLLALHEVAAETWSAAQGTTTSTPASHAASAARAASAEPAVGTEEGAASALTPRRSLHIALVAGVLALVLAVSTAVLLIMRLDDGGDHAVAPPGQSTAGASSSAPTYSCRVEKVGGLWYAGNSRTQDAELATGNSGPDVAEAQCLLRRAGISPGGIDGMFGPLTRRAVMTMQKRSGLEDDGIVGPLTWKALRG
ncbi:peptidoglycan-binding protein [Streptomyces sp. NY05-11A]|uniref:peptidoglycan-binding protein n=1 Tax=Streptomyces soliscabiei TaxID=588897 RepID=UPI0029BCB95F|nr:peptidoglycan-binding protein [Streptomyces sp. NY05-11A]MDX2682699.1 peptidoglycan-binding protein [Streptomyces sp. NY05-11A]